MRWAGRGRHGLLSRSSAIAVVWNWFAMQKGRRLIQIQSVMRGVFEIAERRVRESLWYRRLTRPKTVFGMTMVLKSLKVKRRIVWRKYTVRFAACVRLCVC